MIVICTKCQAKFRVADDKIGPRGAKVRCSRCQTIFHVHAEAAAPSGPPQVAPPPLPQPPPIPQSPRGPDVELESALAGAAAGASEAAVADADPFAAAGFGSAVEAAPSGPFAAPAPSADDPFAQRAADDPFAPAAGALEGAPGEAGRLAVTDLSHLLGPTEPGEHAEPAEPAPDLLAPEPPGLGPPAAPDDGGLALEDRTTPPPLPASGPRPPLEAGGVIGVGGHAMGVDPQAFGAFDFGATDADASLALANEPAPEPGVAPVPPPPEAAAEAALALAAPAPSPRPPPAEEAAPLADERTPVARSSHLRAVAVNAIALAALLLVAFAILVLWRSEGPLEAASLRPSALLAALGRGGAAGPFAAVEIRSGAYEREKGPPLIFVRGKVVSRAPAPVRGVKVVVEIVRARAVVARGEALAGAVPTAEELYQAGDGAAVAALAQAASARAPAEIRPGDAVPFLVAIADSPADLAGASVRVELAAAGGRPP